jgi:hypothetical protein
MCRLPYILLLALVAVSAGCVPSEEVGRCNDQDLAEALVFDNAGFPAYAGQALTQQSCGNGSFCHSSGIPGPQRLGVPHGLDFDMVGSRDEMEVDEDAVERLRHGREVTFEWRNEIYGSVRTGYMPPGVAGSDNVVDLGYRFADGNALPDVSSAEGQEILEQWLACGPPVVGSVTMFPADVDPIGDVVPRGTPMQVPEPNFTSIYEIVISPHCGVSCHGTGVGSQIAQSGLDLSTQEMAYAELVGVEAGGDMCSGMGTLVVANDPDSSLLVEKMTQTSPSCGTVMPLVRLPADLVEPIREWITMGAAND